MTLLPCGHDPARQFWGKCGVCGSLNRPTVSEPRTDLRDAGDCGGAYHYGLCDSCGTYISVVPEAAQPIDRFDRSWWHYADDCPASPAAQPIDVERLTRAIRTYRYNLDVNERSNDVAALAAAEYVRLSGEE